MGRLHSAMATVPPPEPEKGTHEIDFVRWIQQMQTNLAETVGGVLLRGARPVQIGSANGATIRASVSPGRLVGWSMRVSTLATDPAVVHFRDGQDANADLIAAVVVAPGRDAQQWLAPGGISFQNGLFVEILTGAGLSTPQGAVFLGGAE
ncbi:hypothetical protein ABZ341_41635 [Streptomyces sp. NPDC006173]|uniref:hypothetical protein n=1 Tax=Streptomyces sp. NPDC006173 TaxID=3155349 RepID=UPI00340F7C12